MTQAAGSPAAPQLVEFGTAARWVIFAAILGSGIALLDSTVVNVALPASVTTWAAGSRVCSGRSTATC